MKKFNVLYLVSILLLSMSHIANASSSVWKISNGKTNLYLGGTVHVLAADDYPLPAEFEQAYALANTLVLETDMAKLESVEFQKTMMKELSYPLGQSLVQHLTPDTYALLAEFCASRGISMHAMNQFKPSMVSLVLTMTELQRLNLSGVGVDNYYNAKAERDGKALGQLETVEQQLDFIADMGNGKDDELIRYSLEDIKELPTFMQEMKTAWRVGNNQALIDLAITPISKDFPDIYQSLLVIRNTNWLPKIEAMFDNDDTELVLVGALHLVGEDGLLQRLEASGYKVTQL